MFLLLNMDNIRASVFHNSDVRTLGVQAFPGTKRRFFLHTRLRVKIIMEFTFQTVLFLPPWFQPVDLLLWSQQKPRLNDYKVNQVTRVLSQIH